MAGGCPGGRARETGRKERESREREREGEGGRRREGEEVEGSFMSLSFISVRLDRQDDEGSFGFDRREKSVL